jgi:hypothetical protein
MRGPSTGLLVSLGIRKSWHRRRVRAPAVPRASVCEAERGVATWSSELVSNNIDAGSFTALATPSHQLSRDVCQSQAPAICRHQDAPVCDRVCECILQLYDFDVWFCMLYVQGPVRARPCLHAACGPFPDAPSVNQCMMVTALIVVTHKLLSGW